MEDVLAMDRAMRLHDAEVEAGRMVDRMIAGNGADE